MSALLAFSPFKLRAQPFDGLGGMYVTSNGENNEITIDPEVPGVGHQRWIAKEVDGNKDGFTIVDFKDQAYGWAYTDPEVTLTLSKSPSVFKAQVVERPNGKVIVRISADKNIIGATWYVGTSGNALIIQPIPVIPNPPAAPLWELSPVDTN